METQLNNMLYCVLNFVVIVITSGTTSTGRLQEDRVPSVTSIRWNSRCKLGSSSETRRRCPDANLFQVSQTDHRVPVRHLRLLRLHHRTQRKRNLKEDREDVEDELEETRSSLLRQKNLTTTHEVILFMTCQNGWKK